MSMSSMKHVHPGVKMGQNVKIGPFCYIEEGVEIGNQTIIEPNVTIYSGCTIGNECHIYPGAVIGAPPQDLSYRGEETQVVIGDRVTVREHVTIHRGTKASGRTVVGDGCFLMAYAHVAHDCILGNHVILANAVNLGGHVRVGDHANLGGMVPVHQFSRIGSHAMIGGGVVIRKDVPPYVKVGRDPAAFIGVNSIGLKRKGFSEEAVNQIMDIYRLLFVRHRNIRKAIDAIESEVPETSFRQEILDFIKDSDRGLIKGL